MAELSKPKPQRGQCPACGRFLPVKKDPTPRKHVVRDVYGVLQECDGINRGGR